MMEKPNVLCEMDWVLVLVDGCREGWQNVSSIALARQVDVIGLKAPRLAFHEIGHKVDKMFGSQQSAIRALQFVIRKASAHRLVDKHHMPKVPPRPRVLNRIVSPIRFGPDLHWPQTHER